ncbi:hypothetical protein B0H14DRAFT_2270196, partial [Mycena olivaceomarginata]
IPIPPDIQPDLLPPQDLSVWDFASFELPPSTRVVAKKGRRRISPNILLLEARKAPKQLIYVPYSLPPDELVEQLYKYATTSLAPTETTAVRCLHLPGADNMGLMPLWIVEYWKQVMDIRPDHTRWTRAKQLLMNRAKLHRANEQSPGVVDRVSEALHGICWFEQIMGFSNKEPIAALSLYASRNWFSDIQQSHMLDLLRMDV